MRLGIPLYGCDPLLHEIGGKSGSRQAFREAGIPLPDGAEDLRDTQDLAAALADLKRRQPRLSRAVVKLNHGFSGEGNAVFSFAGCPEDDQQRWMAAHLPLNLTIEARDLRWERFAAKLAESGGIVEAWLSMDGVRSPSVQLRITPVGDVEMISTHDQILGGPSGQIFQACTFPADPAYALEIQRLALRVGDVLKRRGVLGRFGVDFVSVPRDDGWQHFAIEINLRKGGTTHTYQMLQFLTGGRYDPKRARVRDASRRRSLLLRDRQCREPRVPATDAAGSVRDRRPARPAVRRRVADRRRVHAGRRAVGVRQARRGVDRCRSRGRSTALSGDGGRCSTRSLLRRPRRDFLEPVTELALLLHQVELRLQSQEESRV